MNRKLYVGNLGFDVTEEQVKELFSAHGEVQEVKIITDRYTGRPRGFAFVKMASPEEAGKARDALNGQPFVGRNLVIDFARTEQEGGGRGGDRGGRGGFGGDRGGFGGPRGDRDGNRADRGDRGGDRGGYRSRSFDDEQE